MKPVCLKPDCPKKLPMVLLEAESTPAHREWMCPHDGLRRKEVTGIGVLGSLAPPVLCISGVITITLSVLSLLHGDAAGAHEMLDMPDFD